MEAQERDPVRELLVVRGHQAAVAESEDVLGREEAEGRDDAGAGSPCCAEGLRRVLDDRHAQLGEAGQRHHAPEQVHGHQCARLRRHPRRDIVRIEVQGRRVDVREHWRRAAAGDRLGGRVEREGRADDLVAGPDPDRVEREH